MNAETNISSKLITKSDGYGEESKEANKFHNSGRLSDRGPRPVVSESGDPLAMAKGGMKMNPLN